MKKPFVLIAASAIMWGSLVVSSPSSTTAAAAKPALQTVLSSDLQDSYAAVSVVADRFKQPWGLTVTKEGEILVVRSGAQDVGRLSDGKWTTVTGQAQSGYVDGVVQAAKFHNPTDIAVDGNSIIYIADTDNHVIRKLMNGKVYTVAGNGQEGYMEGKYGDAQFYAPSGLAIDANNNVYVADTLNHVIRRITPEGEVSTYAGGKAGKDGYQDGSLEEALFNEPTGLVFDERGGLYVSDSGNHLIRYIYNGHVTTIAGSPTELDDFGYMIGGYQNGDRTEAKFNRPRGLAYDQGVLFVADSLNYRIRAVQPDGKVVSLAGQSTPGDAVGAADAAQFNQPSGLLYHDGKLYISDTLNHAIKQLEVDPLALQPVRTKEDLLAATELLPVSETIQLWLDSKPVGADSAGHQAFQEGGRLYVPVRMLFEAWGAEVSWDKEKRVAFIKKGDWKLELGTSNQQAVRLIEGVSYIRISELEEMSGFLTIFSEEHNAIVIGS